MFLLAHQALRRDADAVVAAARRLDEQSVTAAADLLAAFDVAEAMLRHHHVAEDTLVWPAIVARRPAYGPAIDDLAQEHELVERWLGEVRRALTELASPDAVDRAAVAVDLIVATTALQTVLLAHLLHEERVAVPLISDAFTGEEWLDIDARRTATLSPEETALSLAWILSALPEGQRESVAAAKLPAPVVSLWRSEWAPAYSARVAALAA
jgi:hemerythrin-like domain-containing protein